MYGLHYNNSKKFTEAKFKRWSKKVRELRDKYTDDKLDEFKIELNKLSNMYYSIEKNIYYYNEDIEFPKEK